MAEHYSVGHKFKTCFLCVGINGDVTRASIMAAAASIPELLVSMVGTFFTEADVGASAIVGSAVFNTLAIPALCALVTSRNEVMINSLHNIILSPENADVSKSKPPLPPLINGLLKGLYFQNK